MMARISCSLTSKLMPLSALTPPKESEMSSSLRMTSPMLRDDAIVRSGCLAADGREGSRIADHQVGGNHAAAAVLELDEGFDVLRRFAGVQRVDQHRVFLRDEIAAHLARSRELVVVGVELLVQDE